MSRDFLGIDGEGIRITMPAQAAIELAHHGIRMFRFLPPSGSGNQDGSNVRRFVGSEAQHSRGLCPMRKPPLPIGGESAELIPRRLIFGDLDRSVVRISRDGTRIAFRAPADGVLGVWVALINDIDNARPMTAVTDRNVGPWIVWMHDDRHIVFFRNQGGHELWRLCRAGRIDFHAREIRMRGRYRKDFQSRDLSEHDPGILDAVEILVEGPDGRLHHRGGTPVPRGAIAVEPRRPHRAATADRPGRTMCA
jgi:hypothetical protein